MGGAQPKIHTTPLNQPMAAGWARIKHSASPHLMGGPTDWVQAYLAETDETPSWWPELWSIGPGQLSNAEVQQLAKNGLQVLGCQLPRMTFGLVEHLTLPDWSQMMKLHTGV